VDSIALPGNTTPSGSSQGSWHSLCMECMVDDGNWVSGRQPTDLRAFNRAMIRLFLRSLAASHL
jgi:hypothetical protein